MSGPLLSRTRRRARVASVSVVLAVGMAVAVYSQSQPSEKTSRCGVALALAEQGPPVKARAALLSCLEEEPDNPAVLAAMVRVLPTTGATPPDIEPFTARWCRAAPDDPAAFRARFATLQQLHRQAEAIETAERVLALAPNDHDTRAQLTSSYLAVGRYDDAARECRVLMEQSSLPRSETLAALGSVEAGRGNNAAAARLLDEALAQAPEHPGALLARGIVYQQVGEDAQAITTLRRVKPRYPNERISVLHHLGLSLARVGRADEAKITFDELLKVQDALVRRSDADSAPGDGQRQLRAARSLLSAGMPRDAAEVLHGAVARLGPSRALLAALADCYDALGAPEQANRTRALSAQLPN